MKKKTTSLAILGMLSLLGMSMLSLNIQPVKANLGLVTITVQYADGCPRSGADVRKIWPEPMWYLGTTNESGIVETDVLDPGDYLVDAWYEGSQFGPNTSLTVDETGTGSTTIQEDYEITPPIIQILSPQNTTYANYNVPLTFTVNDYSPISWMGYSLDNQANVTSGNTTLTVSLGPHSIIVYANDTYGNMGSSNKTYFTIESPPVGGIWVPVDKNQLLIQWLVFNLPYIALVAALTIIAVTIYVKRKKEKGYTTFHFPPNP